MEKSFSLLLPGIGALLLYIFWRPIKDGCWYLYDKVATAMEDHFDGETF